MFELSTDVRTQVSNDRIEALRDAARPRRPGPARRVSGRFLIRLGTALGGSGALPPVPQPCDDVPAPAGTSSQRWLRPVT